MNEITGRINTLNQGGYIFIQMFDGVIFLYNSKIKIESPDIDSMNDLARNQFTITIELVYDKEEYEKTFDSGVFTKTIKLKDIHAIRRFKDVKI